MSDNLRDDLEAIEGVGEATTDAVLDVIEEYDQKRRPYLLKAFEAAERSDDRQAAVYLRRASGGGE